MIYLILASLTWSFSFGIIKSQLATVSPGFLACVRLGLAGMVFLPFLRVRNLRRDQILKLAGIGFVQYGVMYLCYLSSFRFLRASEIALFTVTTPLFVAIISSFHERRYRIRVFFVALLSVISAFFVVFTGSFPVVALWGFVLVQISNIAFAAGQLWYRNVMPSSLAVSDVQVFAVLYFAGALLASVTLASQDPFIIAQNLNFAQWMALVYLSLIPTALAFFLWNKGSRSVAVARLAILNNLKVPLAVAVSLLVFETEFTLERAVRLICAFLLLALAIYFSEKSQQ